MNKMIINLVIASNVFFSCNAMDAFDISTPKNLVLSIHSKVANSAINPYAICSLTLTLIAHLRNNNVSLLSFLNTQGQSALHIAAALHSEKVVKILLDPRLCKDSYAFLSLQDLSGNTAAHCLFTSMPKKPNNLSALDHANNCKNSAQAILQLMHQAAGDRINELQEIYNQAGKRYIDYLDSEKTTENSTVDHTPDHIDDHHE